MNRATDLDLIGGILLYVDFLCNPASRILRESFSGRWNYSANPQYSACFGYEFDSIWTEYICDF
jgi:hypothetical protein